MFQAFRDVCGRGGGRVGSGSDGLDGCEDATTNEGIIFLPKLYKNIFFIFFCWTKDTSFSTFGAFLGVFKNVLYSAMKKLLVKQQQYWIKCKQFFSFF